MRAMVDSPSTKNLQSSVAPRLGRVYRLPQIGFRSVYRLPRPRRRVLARTVHQQIAETIIFSDFDGRRSAFVHQK